MLDVLFAVLFVASFFAPVLAVFVGIAILAWPKKRSLRALAMRKAAPAHQ